MKCFVITYRKNNNDEEETPEEKKEQEAKAQKMINDSLGYTEMVIQYTSYDA